MHRFYIEAAQSSAKTLTLSERESHHAQHVLRVAEGDRVAALDGQGSELLCQVQSVGKAGVQLKVYQRNSAAPAAYRVTLIQAVPKGKAMEAIIQKATELGVHRIVPILSERTVAHIDTDSSETKVDKWRWIAIDAIKQSGSAWLPKIDPPLKPSAFLSQAERFELPLIATLQPDARHPRVFFRDFAQEKGRLPRDLSVWVGPEGDFTPAEVNAIRSAGALPITLGPVVLRCETAAFYCLSVLNYELNAPA